jgi:hypothetical protein
MAEWRKDLSKNAIRLAVYNMVVADIAVAADNKALVVDIAAAVDNKKLAVVDRKLAAHNLVVKSMAAVGDNNNPAQYGPER